MNYSRVDRSQCGSIAIELTNSAIPVELVNVELNCDESKVLRIFDSQPKREPGRGPRAINKANDPSNPNDRLVVGF